MGARTVAQAQRETGYSRQELWEWMDDGTLPWFSHGGRGTRFVAWKALVERLEGEHREFQQSRGADARTSLSPR
jgi:predicted DNA-binding transcriptional regulator AlpA